MSGTQASFLRERPYLAVFLTYFFVDVLNDGRLSTMNVNGLRENGR